MFPEIEISIKDFDTRTALVMASEKDHHEAFFPIVPGININAKDRYYYTVVIEISKEGNYEVIKLFLSVPRIDVNDQVRGVN